MADQTPPDLTTTIGRVRKYVPDLVQLPDPKNPAAAPQYYFSDVEILGYISEYSDEDKPRRTDIKRAAADVIEALANNEALVLKKIKTEDLETDGPSVANSLRQGAKALRQQADNEDLASNDMFAIIPFRHNHPRTVLPGRF